MAPVRDPLSVRYDRTVRRILIQAIAAHREGRGVTVWVHTTGPEFRQHGPGGLTAYERAFLRSAYYQTTKVPPRHYSLKRTWGKVERRGSRYGRYLRLRLFRYGSGSYRAIPESEKFTVHEHLRARPGEVGGGR